MLHSITHFFQSINEQPIELYSEAGLQHELALFLKQHNIQTRIVYPAIHSTDAYKSQGEFPSCEYVSSHGLFLPSHLQLTNEQVDFISCCIRMFF